MTYTFSCSLCYIFTLLLAILLSQIFAGVSYNFCTIPFLLRAFYFASSLSLLLVSFIIFIHTNYKRNVFFFLLYFVELLNDRERALLVRKKKVCVLYIFFSLYILFCSVRFCVCSRFFFSF